MANKIAKLTMLSMLFSTMLGLGLTSGVSNTLATFTKTAVSYATEDDLNDHTHSSDWVALEQEDFDTGGDYVSGVIFGESSENISYYYLDEDISLSTDLNIHYNVAICLNGNTLTSSLGSRFLNLSNGVLSIYDCSGDDCGTIKGASAGTGVFVVNGTFNMYGGTIEGFSASGVYLEADNCAFNMYGGKIFNNSSTEGGGVWLRGGSFNMYGGTISGNSADYGNGLYLRWGTFNMYGGYLADDVYDNYSNSNISIKGGYLSTTAYNSIKDEDYIPAGYEAKSTNDTTWSYIVVATSHADTINGQTIEFDNYLDEVSYKDSTSITLSEGNYYLATDLNLNITIGFSGGYAVYLCLNGKTLEGTGSDSVINFDVGAILILCDCSSDDSGTITGGNATYGGGVCNNGAFTMYGGTISGNTATYGGGVCNNDEFNMYGGTISGNTAPYGGGININMEYCSFNMYDGYLGGDTYNYEDSGSISISGGYFTSISYKSIKDYIDIGSIGIDISTLGIDLDNNYLEDYPYAVYKRSTNEYQIEDIEVTYDTSYTPIVTDFNGYVLYSYIDTNDSNNNGTGLPIEIGEYTVTAYIFEVTTNSEETTILVATKEFSVTINSSVTETPEEGEGESGETGEEGESGEQDNTSDGDSDNNTTDGDTTTTNDDSIGLSAGTIAGIVIGSVLVLGVIAFLVYFFVFRKRKGKVS